MSLVHKLLPSFAPAAHTAGNRDLPLGAYRFHVHQASRTVEIAEMIEERIVALWRELIQPGRSTSPAAPRSKPKSLCAGELSRGLRRSAS